MSDDDKSSLLGLDEGYNVILTVFDEQMFLLSPKCKKKVSDENYEKQHLQTLVSLSATAASAAARSGSSLSWDRCPGLETKKVGTEFGFGRLIETKSARQ